MSEQSTEVRVWAVPGIKEIDPGDDLGDEIAAAVCSHALESSDRALADGDILVVTSKIASKAEGRIVAADGREESITAETVRTVATRVHPSGDGTLRIVENRLGIVAAAAGVDSSNTPPGTVLLLPEDPDDSAARIRGTLRDRLGVEVGVLVSDTLGRAWRLGQTDAAIGLSGVRPVIDHRGDTDSSGQTLTATITAAADEICAMADLVKGKSRGLPVAVVRGLGHLCDSEALGARSLTRTGPDDMFALGTAEAMAEGYRLAQAGLPLPE